MPRAARLAASALVLAAMLTACGGPGEESGPASSSSQSSAPSIPPPSGAGCAAAGDLEAVAELGLVDAVNELKSTTKFAEYAEIDQARVSKLNALNGVTVFVPVNDAWSDLDTTTSTQLKEDAWKSAAVEYAITPGIQVPDELAADGPETLQSFRSAGDVLTVTAAQGGLVLNGHSQIICSSIAFEGGLIYLTDAVLLPSA